MRAPSFLYGMKNFNSHAHVERDGSVAGCGETLCNFNSHAHVERDSLPAWEYQSNEYFNSHAHVERDVYAGTIDGNLDISTHTLTWSVTNSVLDTVWLDTHFNSHAHVERDAGP